MASYEGVVVVKANLGEQEHRQILSKSKNIIKDHDGQFNHCDTWGVMDLANPVKNISKGAFFHYTFSGENNVVKELERIYKLDSNVVKYMHVNLGNADLDKHMEEYKDRLSRSVKAEKEREQKKREKKNKYF